MPSQLRIPQKSDSPSRFRQWTQSIGPGLITACVVIGPGSILTSSMIGASEGARHKAYAEMLGVDDYVRKPFPMDRLIQSVQRLVG